MIDYSKQGKGPQYLPSTAERLSLQIFPGVELWAQNYESERGPLYGLYEGQVVSMTYITAEEYLLEVPWFRDDPANPDVRLRQSMYELVAPLDVPTDHFDIVYTSAPRPGFSGAHWEVTAWRIPHQDHLGIAQGERPPLHLQDFPTAPDGLPKEATATSPPVPQLGQHWWDAKDFPHGPFWVAVCNEAGPRYEVVGVVYMHPLEDMTKTPEGALEFTDLRLQFTPNHVHVILAPPGFHGFSGPHWDVRVQFTAHEDHMTDMRFNVAAFIPCFEALEE